MTRMRDEAVRRQLIDGIHRRTLAATCRQLLAGSPGTLSDPARALAAAGLSSCEAVSRETRAEKARMVARLSGAGVVARTAEGPEATDDLQFQAFSIDIDPAGLEAALTAAAADGYDLPLRPDPWTVAALGRFATQLDVARPDAVSMRMRLRWHAGTQRRHRFTPEPVDLALVRLPPFLWPLHFLVKPARVIGERLTGRKAHDQLGLFTGAVNLATPESLVAALLELAAPTASDVLVDLGCGDGRIVITAAQRYGCRTIGVERNPALASRARAAVQAARLTDRVSIVEDDLLKADLSQASLVVVFLPGPFLAGILDPLLAQMRPGSRLIAHEQAPLEVPRAADSMHPLFADNALTVAHVWTRR